MDVFFKNSWGLGLFLFQKIKNFMVFGIIDALKA